jgi:hypothetical protein
MALVTDWKRSVPISQHRSAHERNGTGAHHMQVHYACLAAKFGFGLFYFVCVRQLIADRRHSMHVEETQRKSEATFWQLIAQVGKHMLCPSVQDSAPHSLDRIAIHQQGPQWEQPKRWRQTGQVVV